MQTIEKATVVVNNETQIPNPSYFQLLDQVFIGLSEHYQSKQRTQNEEFTKSVETQSKILEEFWNKESERLEPFKRINLDEISINETDRTIIKKNEPIRTENNYGYILTNFNQNGELENIHLETTSKPDTRDEDHLVYNFRFDKNQITYAEKKIIKFNPKSMMPQLGNITQIIF